ncbi:DNA polymerase I, partial [bacterium]|nr:DNA polymerase I [bacterium]
MKFNAKKTVFLIDGSSFLYRAYYGVRPLHTSKGVPVQAVYSFCRMIKKLVKKFDGSFISLVWDSKGKTTRHEMFQDYKANRQAPPSDIFDQKKLIVEFADLIGLHQISKVGVEADDILYSIAQERSKAGDFVVVITSDKDMGQMLTENIVMFDAFKDKIMDVVAFEEKLGVPIAKFPFYFSLLGDASDNIPGVRGIGKKGAMELVNQFNSLEDLYANLDNVKRPRQKTALQNNKDNAFLSRKLFLLQYEKTGVKKTDLQFNKDDWANARSLFAKLEFKTLLKELQSEQLSLFPIVETKMDVHKKYKLRAITTEQQLKELCFQLKSVKAFAVDTETTGLRTLQDECVGISLCMKKGEAYYIPFGHKTIEKQLKKETVITALKPILEDPKIEKYLQNAKFDQLVLLHAGINLQGPIFDTLIAAQLIAKEWQRKKLEDLSERYLDEPMLTYEEIVKQNKYKNFSYVPLHVATQYASIDAHQTFRLKKIFEKELKKEKLFKLFKKLEMPLAHVLFQMESTGIGFDLEKIAKLDVQVSKELVTIEEKILAAVGDEHKNINLNSPKQVEKLLFTDLQLPPQKKSAKRTGYSTDQEVLKELAKVHPVPGLIMRYRELFKLKSTYIDSLPGYVNPETKRIHTTFRQTSVATGRLASSDPNLQNIPADGSGYGIEIRAAFIPQKKHIFLSADYSQIELRVLAHLSKDKNLTNAFLQGHDIHAETAARLFDVELNDVTHDQRQVGKRINFSILYGLTPFGLSKDLDISFGEAKTYIEKYFEQYPDVSVWMDSIVKETKRNGYVETHWGRRRYISGIYEKNRNLYDLAKRVAINTVAQGTAAEIMKWGMINLNNAIKKQNLDAKILLQIHDELLISVAEDQKEIVEKLVKKTLESVVDWEIPLIVTTRFGKDW